MGTAEFRTWIFLRLNGIDDHLREQDALIVRLDSRLWWVLGSVLALGAVAILAAVL
jgi:hypothetical protein